MMARIVLFLLFVSFLAPCPVLAGEDAADSAVQAAEAEGGGAGDGDAADEELPSLEDAYEPSAFLEPEQARFLRERAEEGDPAMQCLYGLALFNGSAGRIDTYAARDWLRKSAEAGNERGGFEYGKMLYLGTGGRVDQQAALAWLLPAAEKGNNEAAYYAGAALLVGEGVEHDAEAGEKWLRQAARSGIVNAQADLGVAYFSGLAGVGQDYGEALRWFTLAAKQAHGDSCNKLGVMHQQGKGVPVDMERAILWFTMGAALGDRYAQYNLALCYMNGDWVARDYTQAARWHEMSARRGNVDSQYYMGCFYAEGIGVKKDSGRAREWLTLAERGGHEQAAVLLEKLWELDDGLTPSTPPPPVMIQAAPLLREFVHEPLKAVNKGRVVLLELGEDVEISPADGEGAWYLTVPGSPGVIYCVGEYFVDGGTMRPGMVIRGVGGGFTGLPGFLRLEDVREATSEDIAASDTGKGADTPAAAKEADPSEDEPDAETTDAE